MLKITRTKIEMDGPRKLASKELRLKPDISQIGCNKQACDAGAVHVEGEATSHSGSAQELCLGLCPQMLMKRSRQELGLGCRPRMLMKRSAGRAWSRSLRLARLTLVRQTHRKQAACSIALLAAQAFGSQQVHSQETDSRCSPHVCVRGVADAAPASRGPHHSARSPEKVRA